MFEAELESVVDLFENEDIVVTQCVLADFDFRVQQINIGLKDANGDICKLLCVHAKVLSE